MAIIRTPLAALLLCTLLSLMPASSFANDQRTIESGGTLTVTGNGPLENLSGALKGKVTVTDKELAYQAPAVENAMTETVKYKDGNVESAIDVTVQPKEVYAKAARILFLLFVVAVLLESALALIFNWRVFLAIFDSRGMKTLVSFLMALLITLAFDLDALTQLVNIYSSTPHTGDSTLGRFITALILAGGSSGVNNLFLALGFRSPQTLAKVDEKPKGSEAWLAVRLKRKDAVGPVFVHMGAPGSSPMPIVGSIPGTSRGGAWKDYFWRDRGRFPQSGGHTVVPGAYEVWLSGKAADGTDISCVKWGPHAVANRAIVDIEMAL